MRGIDISGYEVGLDFNKINTDIVIIKATEGETYINPLLKMQYAKARAKGFKVGFYHFLRTNNPIDEAKHFLATIEGLKSDCKYIIDAESEPNGVSLRVRKFADYLISKGKEPALYTGLCFYNEEMTSIVKDLPLWVAAYNKTRPLIKSVGWQYSETLTIGSHKIDHNVFDNGILLGGGVSNVAKGNSKVLLLQKVCNRVGIRGANGIKLDEDGLTGKNTNAAKIKLKAYIAEVTK